MRDAWTAPPSALSMQELEALFNEKGVQVEIEGFMMTLSVQSFKILERLGPRNF